MFGLLIIQTMSISTCAAQDGEKFSTKEYKPIGNNGGNNCQILQNRKTGKIVFQMDTVTLSDHALDTLDWEKKTRHELFVQSTRTVDETIYVIHIIRSEPFRDLFVINTQQIVFTVKSSREKTVKIYPAGKKIISLYYWYSNVNEKEKIVFPSSTGEQ